MPKELCASHVSNQPPIQNVAVALSVRSRGIFNSIPGFLGRVRLITFKVYSRELGKSLKERLLPWFRNIAVWENGACLPSASQEALAGRMLPPGISDQAGLYRKTISKNKLPMIGIGSVQQRELTQRLLLHENHALLQQVGRLRLPAEVLVGFRRVRTRKQVWLLTCRARRVLHR